MPVSFYFMFHFMFYDHFYFSLCLEIFSLDVNDFCMVCVAKTVVPEYNLH